MIRSRARKHWLLLALLLGVAVIVLARGWILQTVASGLIVNENCPITDYVWIAESEHGADRRFDHAAELYRKRPSLRLILVGQYRQRLVQIGEQPSQEAIDRRELASRGVPAIAVIVIPASAQNAWEEAQCVTLWMASRPDAEVLLLCDQFDSRRQRRIVDSVMDASHAKRIHVHALADRRHNENDWWQSRDGVKHVTLSFLELIYAWCRGSPGEATETWTPDGYEQALKKKLAEARP